jgi:hypothetical protein
MSDTFEPGDEISDESARVEELARTHPSAGDGSEVEGVEQEGNTEGDERAADGGTGAGEDYSGSGY